MGIKGYWNQWRKDFFISKTIRFKATGYDKDSENRKKWALEEAENEKLARKKDGGISGKEG